MEEDFYDMDLDVYEKNIRKFLKEDLEELEYLDILE